MAEMRRGRLRISRHSIYAVVPFHHHPRDAKIRYRSLRMGELAMSSGPLNTEARNRLGGLVIGSTRLRRVSLFSVLELNEVGRRLTGCNFPSYSYLSGFRNAAMAIALLPFSEKQEVGLLREIFRRNRLPAGGFVGACGRPLRRPQRGPESPHHVRRRPPLLDQRHPDGRRRPHDLGREGVQSGVRFRSEAMDPMSLILQNLVFLKIRRRVRISAFFLSLSA